MYQTEVGGRLLKQTVYRPLAPRKREVAEAHPDGMRERRFGSGTISAAVRAAWCWRAARPQL